MTQYSVKIRHMKQIKTIYTHSGAFHADDVFAVALLKMLYPDAEIVRSRNKEDFDSADIVVDVGDVYDPDHNRFDHHQEGRAGERENGIFYSAMGLVWKHFGLQWCEDDRALFERIDKSFVTYLDADDNGQNTYLVNEKFGVDPVTLDDMVRLFRPAYGEPDEFDARFLRAVDWAQGILELVKAKYVGKLKAATDFADAYSASEDPRFVVMDKYIPLDEIVEGYAEKLLFLVYPDVSGTWRLKTVPKSKGDFESKKSLPAEWAGLRDDELRNITGVKDAKFCHNARFIAGAETKEGAVALLKLALES